MIKNSKAVTLLIILMYVMSIVIANLLTSRFGLVAVGFSLYATAGTYSAGLSLLLRDSLQERIGKGFVIAAVVFGATISLFMSNPSIAIASGVAFLVSEFADFLVYTPLRRISFITAVIASNSVGSLLDTVVFLSIAGFPVTMQSVSAQMIAKVLWVTIAPLMAYKMVTHVLSDHAV